jgi:hypothetical protein
LLTAKVAAVAFRQPNATHPRNAVLAILTALIIAVFTIISTSSFKYAKYGPFLGLVLFA